MTTTTRPAPLAAHPGAAAEQRHILDELDTAFARLPADHPERCSTAADYPSWAPYTTHRVDGPICTLAEAWAAGLDITPTLGDLTAMAEMTIQAHDDAPTPETDLAHVVLLMAAEIDRLRSRIEAAGGERR